MSTETRTKNQLLSDSLLYLEDCKDLGITGLDAIIREIREALEAERVQLRKFVERNSDSWELLDFNDHAISALCRETWSGKLRVTLLSTEYKLRDDLAICEQSMFVEFGMPEPHGNWVWTERMTALELQAVIVKLVHVLSYLSEDPDATLERFKVGYRDPL